MWQACKKGTIKTNKVLQNSHFMVSYLEIIEENFEKPPDHKMAKKKICKASAAMSLACAMEIP